MNFHLLPMALHLFNILISLGRVGSDMMHPLAIIWINSRNGYQRLHNPVPGRGISKHVRPSDRGQVRYYHDRRHVGGDLQTVFADGSVEGSGGEYGGHLRTGERGGGSLEHLGEVA